LAGGRVVFYDFSKVVDPVVMPVEVYRAANYIVELFLLVRLPVVRDWIFSFRDHRRISTCNDMQLIIVGQRDLILLHLNDDIDCYVFVAF
jgi:predicted acyltransferase